MLGSGRGMQSLLWHTELHMQEHPASPCTSSFTLHLPCPGCAVSKGDHEAGPDEFVWIIGNALAAALGCFSELIPACCWPPVLSLVTAEHAGSVDVVGLIVVLCLSFTLQCHPLCKAPQEVLSLSSRFAGKRV